MKKVLMVLVSLLGLCFVSCSSSRQTTNYLDEITGEISMGGFKINQHTLSADYGGEDGVLVKPPYINALIEYPQLTGLKSHETQEKINKRLKQVAIEMISDRSADETLKYLNKVARQDSSEIWSVSSEFEIIYVDSQIISLIFEGDWFFGGPYPGQCKELITFNLIDAEIVPFTEYFSEDSFINAIMLQKFEWLEGQYAGGYVDTEPEVISEFIEAFMEYTDESSFIWDSAYSFDWESPYNFCIDEQFIYIKFYFEDSLDGYVVLKFRQDDLK